jgi:orotate phosphoribosyltransferase
MSSAIILSLVHAKRGHFSLESGHHGELWLDLETLCRRPSIIRPLASKLADRIRRYDVDAVCGPLNEGAFVALMVASKLGCDFTYAESSPQIAAAGELFRVAYRLPAPLHEVVRNKRVAVVNDVVSAGSAVRGAYDHLRALDADVPVVATLLVLGDTIVRFARENHFALEALAEHPYNLWPPNECPLCRSGIPIDAR